MELWIRSQKKTRLIKVNNILAYDFEDGSYGIQINGECFVGEYTTEERALEVLDKIHQRLINLATIEIAPDSYKVLPKDTSNVYEMPKE